MTQATAEQPKPAATPKQSISRTKAIKAVNGNIVIEVYGPAKDANGIPLLQQPVLRTRLLTIQDAILHANAGAVMVSRMESPDERRSIMEFVKDLRAKIGEAEQQRLAANRDPLKGI